MGLFSNVDKSADLMRGLAERMDIDLGAQVSANPDTAAPVYRSMVLRCSGCRNQDDCAELQAKNDHLDHAPHYCRNRGTFDAGGI